jgi:hypothetical protein
MKNLVGKKVSAVADWGTYKDRTVKGILSVNEITGQYLVTIKKATVSVMEDTIEACPDYNGNPTHLSDAPIG